MPTKGFPCEAFIILLLISHQVMCYEKTLRKIVRNNAKMVQKPFSSDDGNFVWTNSTQLSRNSKRPENHNFYNTNTVYFNRANSKMSNIVISSNSSYLNKLPYKKEITKEQSSYEVRAPRNISFFNLTSDLENNGYNTLVQEPYVNVSKNIVVDQFYDLTASVSVSPYTKRKNSFNAQAVNTGKVQQSISDKENSNQIPDYQTTESIYDSSLFLNGIFMPNVNRKDRYNITKFNEAYPDTEPSNDNPDYLVEETSGNVVLNSLYNYTTSEGPFACTIIKETPADIDAQTMFSELDIEPSWMSAKHYWTHIFDSRYEALLRKIKWPPLKVIIVPRTHVDSIWKKSFEHYHHNTVSKILSNVIKKLNFYTNHTFSWNEVSHLSYWWKNANRKYRATLQRLVKAGRFEITTGNWVETDEATTDLFGLVHQFIEGHHWLKENLKYSPTIAWLTNSVTHSPTMTYLLSALGISKLIITNVHYSVEKYLAEYQYSDFIWLQNWDDDIKSNTLLNEVLDKIGPDRVPKHSVLTHYLQFNSAGFRACGPNHTICITDFNFAKPNKNMDINSYNLKEKSELLLEQYSKTGTITSHNTIIAPLGGPYRYESQAEFDYQFNNYQKIIDYLNANRDIYKATLQFGTAKDYFDSILEKHKVYATLKGDFLNFADLQSGTPAYWTGFFTSRPVFKIMLRRLQSTLRTTEILVTFAVSNNAFQRINMAEIIELLSKSRETVARLSDRNVVSGTLTANTLRYAHKQILTTLKDCWHIQEVTASLLTTDSEHNKTVYVQKYLYHEGEVFSVFKTVSPGDQFFIFNSLGHENTEIIELATTNPNIRIINHNKKDVIIQINPMWKYNSENYISISQRFYKISFEVKISPLTFELYKLKASYEKLENVASIYCSHCKVDEVKNNAIEFPFTIEPVGPGDIQLESYKHRFIFDELSGFLKTVVEKDSNTEKTVTVDFGAFRSSHDNAGMFLFKANNTKPIADIILPYRVGSKQKNVMIIYGHLTTQIICIYGRLLQHSLKYFNLANNILSNTLYLETIVDYEVSPKNRELELFLSIQTDIANGNSPEIITDNNSFQYTARILNISRRLESNLYPFTSMTYIQDRKSRFTIITDHAQGVTALQEGQLTVMLDRRVLFNDGRGSNEGLADSSKTTHRHFVLLENFHSTSTKGFAAQSELKLPSLTAIRLANSLNTGLDIYLMDRKKYELCYYSYLPLIKTSFPCDVTLFNYRIDLNAGEPMKSCSNTALMILHKQSFSCEFIYDFNLRCNSDHQFSLEKILHHHVSGVYRTNLAGTNQGVQTLYINKNNFSPMELLTLRIHF